MFTAQNISQPFRHNWSVWQNVELHTVILHSKITKITTERPQITPVPKIMPFVHIFFTRLASPNNFFHSPTPRPNWGKPPILQMAFQSLLFVSKVKKTYQWSQLGKVDPKRLPEYDVAYWTHMGNVTKRFVNRYNRSNVYKNTWLFTTLVRCAFGNVSPLCSHRLDT